MSEAKKIIQEELVCTSFLIGYNRHLFQYKGKCTYLLNNDVFPNYFQYVFKKHTNDNSQWTKNDWTFCSYLIFKLLVECEEIAL